MESNSVKNGKNDCKKNVNLSCVYDHIIDSSISTYDFLRP